MKHQSALKWMIPWIGLLALFAAGMGLFYQTPGQPYLYTNHRGETVTLNGSGLYQYDTLSTAAQMQGNDLVTLLVGLPLLAVSSWLALRGSFRGHLLLTGTLGFFLYTYMSMAMLTAFNPLFLVYVILFSLSLFAFILSMLDFDLKTVPGHFSERLPRKSIAGLMFVVSGFLTLTWISRILITPAHQPDPGVGKHHDPGHPGHGPGRDRADGLPGRGPPASAQRLGLPAIRSFRAEGNLPGVGGECDGHQHDSQRCAGQRCDCASFSGYHLNQPGHGLYIAQKRRRSPVGKSCIHEFLIHSSLERYYGSSHWSRESRAQFRGSPGYRRLEF